MSARRIVLIVVLVLGVLALLAYWGNPMRGGGAAGPRGGMVLTSPAFANGDPMPVDYTADGRNVSPPLVWDGVPVGTASFALIAEDPDVPLGTFTHWLLCDVPAGARYLPEGLPDHDLLTGEVKGVQGRNGFRKTGYGGPDPPAGKPHRYTFRLFALDEKVEFTGGYNRKQLQAGMQGHILAEAHLSATYGREEK